MFENFSIKNSKKDSKVKKVLKGKKAIKMHNRGKNPERQKM